MENVFRLIEVLPSFYYFSKHLGKVYSYLEPSGLNIFKPKVIKSDAIFTELNFPCFKYKDFKYKDKLKTVLFKS